MTNHIEISYEEVPPYPYSEAILSYMYKLLGHLEVSGVEISLVFCNDITIQALNAQYRGKDKPTDVLSFPQVSGFLLGDTEPLGNVPWPRAHEPDATIALGDIVISLNQVEAHSKIFGVSLEEELKRVLLHGVLHLMGHDHQTNDSAEPMLQLQESILSHMVEVRLF